MAVAAMSHLISRSREARCGVGAFNVISLEHAEGIVRGAEQIQQPVVLALSENTVRFHDSLSPLAAACLALADEAGVPVALHLDHVTERALCDDALALGLRSVMFDGSNLSYAENVQTTASVVEQAHAVHAWVEAELGEIGGKDGVHAPGARTDPDLAVSYVASTGVDALAVAIGSSHGMVRQEAHLDFGLLRKLADALPVPLVLHGSSGVGDEVLRRAIQTGIVKVNIGTQLNVSFTSVIRQALLAGECTDPRRFLASGRDAIAAKVAHLLGIIAGI